MIKISLLLLILFIIIILYLWSICPNTTRIQEFAVFNHMAFAHRGYHAKEELIPENSMLAFKEAVKHGYGIELDVHLTKDNQVVVFHDDTLMRLCNIDSTIESMTYLELQQLHLLNTPERIPLLSKVLDYIDGKVPLLIELKLPTKSTLLCNYLNKQLKNYDGLYLIQSFNSMGLWWFRLHAPAILRGQLSSNLTRKASKEPLMIRLMIQYLLTNWIGRPDFISYKLADAHNLSLWINQHIFHIPVAVWTLRSQKAYEDARANYNMEIFEKFT
ncbi:MAG: glycerophosphodiester phosphodiesterase family protein [Lachnospiraceae bacterium]